MVESVAAMDRESIDDDGIALQFLDVDDVVRGVRGTCAKAPLKKRAGHVCGCATGESSRAHCEATIDLERQRDQKARRVIGGKVGVVGAALGDPNRTARQLVGDGLIERLKCLAPD